MSFYKGDEAEVYVYIDEIEATYVWSYAVLYSALPDRLVPRLSSIHFQRLYGSELGGYPALGTSPTGPTCLHIAQTCLDRPTCPTNDPYVWTSEEIAAETIPKDDSNVKSPERPKI